MSGACWRAEAAGEGGRQGGAVLLFSFFFFSFFFLSEAAGEGGRQGGAATAEHVPGAGVSECHYYFSFFLSFFFVRIGA